MSARTRMGLSDSEVRGAISSSEVLGWCTDCSEAVLDYEHFRMSVLLRTGNKAPRSTHRECYVVVAASSRNEKKIFKFADRTASIRILGTMYSRPSAHNLSTPGDGAERG
jgi:hypothetical protein